MRQLAYEFTPWRRLEAAGRGQGDDLGGGVWKKRLNKNMHRSIVITKAKKRWIYTFLFAKKDRENIGPKELKQFQKLAKYDGGATDAQFGLLVDAKELLEICHGRESEPENETA